jgi:hypothetical protein
MQINLIYDDSVNNAPAGFKSAITAAAQYLDNLLANPITVNIAVGFGEIINNSDISIPVAPYPAEGFARGYNAASYAELKQYLTAHSTSSNDISALDAFSPTDPTNGGTFSLSGAQAKAWGLLPATGTELDGSVGFNSSLSWDYNVNDGVVPPNQVDFMGAALHELTHALGRFDSLSAPGSPWYSLLDLFRYSAPGVHQLVFGQPAYFSIDGGTTHLANFSVTNPDGDWDNTSGNDAFNGDARTFNVFTLVDVAEMDVLGFRETARRLSAPISVPRPNSAIFELDYQ